MIIADFQNITLPGNSHLVTPYQQLATPIRLLSPWQPRTSKAVQANPQELTQLLLLVRGFYQQHQCPRILPKQSLDPLFIQPREENKPSQSS